MVLLLRRLAVLVTITGGVFINLAVPAGGKSFSLPAVLNKTYVHNPLRYEKRKFSSPRANYNGDRYTTPVVIGESQTLNLLFDSGSSDMWVFSKYLDESQWGTHNIFDPEESDSFKLIDGSTIEDKYGEGDGGEYVYGKVGSDVVSIGTLSVPTQIFGVPDVISPGLLGLLCDGLIGFGFDMLSDIHPNKAPTFMTNVINSLDDPAFAVYLPANANGFFDFGLLPQSRYTGAIKWAPVHSSNGFWQFSSASYMINGKAYGIPGVTAIVDTGTNAMVVQREQLTNYYVNVPGATQGDNGYWTFPCDAELPPLSVMIGYTDYATIPGEYLKGVPTDNTGTTCFGRLETTNVRLNIYGLPLFYAYYSIFDYGGPSFGYAPLRT